jgi:hypothetical protein
MDAQEYCRYLRGHWSIENRLHWCLDVVFREDAVGVACGHAPENMNVLRKTALTLLRGSAGSAAFGEKTKDDGCKETVHRRYEPGLYAYCSLWKVNAEALGRRGA